MRCRGLHGFTNPAYLRDFLFPACCVLPSIAFPVVSEWCQYHPRVRLAPPSGPGLRKSTSGEPCRRQRPEQFVLLVLRRTHRIEEVMFGDPVGQDLLVIGRFSALLTPPVACRTLFHLHHVTLPSHRRHRPAPSRLAPSTPRLAGPRVYPSARNYPYARPSRLAFFLTLRRAMLLNNAVTSAVPQASRPRRESSTE